jgi:hypothetical protein
LAACIPAPQLLKLETTFGEGRSPQSRVNIRRAGRVPGLREPELGERRAPQYRGKTRWRSRRQLGRRQLGGSSTLDVPQLRGCSDPGKFARHGARRASSAYRKRRVRGRPPRPPRPPPGARSRSLLTRRLPRRQEGTQDVLCRGARALARRDPQHERLWKRSLQRKRQRPGEWRRGPEHRARPLASPVPAPGAMLPPPLPLPLPPPPPLVRAWPGPARPSCSCGSSAATAPRSPRLASPRGPAAARLSPSLLLRRRRRRRLCHRCTALCPPPSRLLPLHSSSPALPSGPPQTLHTRDPAHPRHSRACSVRRRASCPSRGAISRYLHQRVPFPTPPSQLAWPWQETPSLGVRVPQSSQHTETCGPTHRVVGTGMWRGSTRRLPLGQGSGWPIVGV